MAGDPGPNTFGAWLRRRRREGGVIQDVLAERIGCSLITLQKIESGERRPSRQMALLLAEQLNVPADEREAFVTFARTGPASATASADGEAGQAPWRTAHRRHTNLPVALTALLGRVHDEAAVRDLLMQSRVRLVTLIGPPGVGKTRLGLQVASELGDSFEDGVFFVDLSPVTDPGMVASTIARALGLRESPNEPAEAVLGAYLRDKKLLLLLDNFEQVLDAAPILAVLLQACPWLKVLVTSREALFVRGERRYNVSPLDLPDQASYAETTRGVTDLEALARNPAVELFVERAQDVQPDFELEEANALDVAAVCAGLDGLPLAIELAAARADVIPLAEMRAGLDRRLHLLTKGARDLPPRQRTLRNAIEWSYSLLPEEDKRTFEDASVFAGGFTLDAAEAVCLSGDGSAPAQERLSSLVSKSLLQRQSGYADTNEERFGFLETLREYALERLEEGEAEVARRRHAMCFMRLAEELEPRVTSNEQASVKSKLLREHDNIRAALAWALQPISNTGSRSPDDHSLDPKSEIGLRLAGSLRVFWLVQGFLTEGRAWLKRTLAAAGVDLDAVDEIKAVQWWKDQAQERGWGLGQMQKVIYGVGMLEHAAGDYAAAHRYFAPSLDIARALGDDALVTSALGALTKTAAWAKDYDEARRLGAQALDLARRLTSPALISTALTDLNEIALAVGDLSSARELQVELLEVTRQSGRLELIGRASYTLGQTALAQGDYAGGRAAMEETLSIARKLGHMEGEAYALRDIGVAARGLGDDSAALTSLREALLLLKRLEQHHPMIEALAWIARVYQDQSNLPDAARLFGAVDRLAKERNLSFGPETALPDPHELARLSESNEEWAAAMSVGATLSLDDTMALALGDEMG